MNVNRACQADFTVYLSLLRATLETVQSGRIKVESNEPNGEGKCTLPRAYTEVDPGTSFRSLAVHLRSLRSCTYSTAHAASQVSGRVPVDQPKHIIMPKSRPTVRSHTTGTCFRKDPAVYRGTFIELTIFIIIFIISLGTLEYHSCLSCPRNQDTDYLRANHVLWTVAISSRTHTHYRYRIELMGPNYVGHRPSRCALGI